MSSAGHCQGEAPTLLAEIVRLQKEGRGAVLASLAWSRGSVPATQQSALLFRDDGSTMGTIGGGALEAAVLAAAPSVLQADRPRLLEFDLTPTQAAASGMICGGRCAVLLEPIAPDRASEVFAAAARAEAAGEPAALITLLAPEAPPRKLALTSGREVVGPAGLVLPDGVRDAAAQSLAEGRSQFIEGPIPALVQPVLPRPLVFIFGAGHIAVGLAHVADLVGFRVVVIGDRAEFADRRRFPRAEKVLVAEVPDAFARLAIGPDSYIVAVTRGHLMDEEVVSHALRTPARYIGMIGSKRKVAAVLDQLRERGFSEENLARLHAPIGLDIGAETVEEIAVSIVAQLIEVRRRPSG